MGGCRVLAVWCAAGQPKDRPGCESRRMTHRAHDIVPSGTSRVKTHLRDVAVAIATLSPPEERNRRQGRGGKTTPTTMSLDSSSRCSLQEQHLHGPDPT